MMRKSQNMSRDGHRRRIELDAAAAATRSPTLAGSWDNVADDSYLYDTDEEVGEEKNGGIYGGEEVSLTDSETEADVRPSSSPSQSQSQSQESARKLVNADQAAPQANPPPRVPSPSNPRRRAAAAAAPSASQTQPSQPSHSSSPSFAALSTSMDQDLPTGPAAPAADSAIRPTPRPRKHRQSSIASSQLSSEPSFIMPSPSQAPDARGESSGMGSMGLMGSPAASWVHASPSNSAHQAAAFVRGSTPGNQRASTPSRTPRGSRTRDSQPRPTKARRRTAPDRSAQAPDHQPAPLTLIQHFLYSVGAYIISVVGGALQLLKPVLSVFLAGTVLLFAYIMIRNGITSAATGLMKPICYLPGSSYFLPFCADSSHHGGSKTGLPHPEFDSLMTLQTSFSSILTASADSASLPLDMKRSESSIRDLKHVVEYSQLPSRSELVLEFTNFISTARAASLALTRFNSRIARAIDHTLSTNRWTMRILSDLATLPPPQRGSIFNKLNPLSPLTGPAAPSPSQAIYDQYVRHTAALEDQIHHLIQEANALLAILQSLDDRLDLIAGIAARDGVATTADRDALFAQLWTKLGGHRAEAARLDTQLQLLRDVGAYRKMAWRHVTATVLKLQEVEAGLDDLRERVAGADVLGARDIPLEWHLENVRLGVQRLEEVRGESRRVGEEEWMRRAMDGAGGASSADGRKPVKGWMIESGSGSGSGSGAGTPVSSTTTTTIVQGKGSNANANANANGDARSPASPARGREKSG